MDLFDAINYIRNYKYLNPDSDKEAVQRAYIEEFTPYQSRSVLVGCGYAMRFSEARSHSFSNTVLSLSKLLDHDDLPFVVVVVRKNEVQFLLANATFIKKISHSSQKLRVDNIRGSFNGSDIIMDYDGTINSPGNFQELFEFHRAFTKKENIDRLVEATNKIVGRTTRFDPTPDERSILMNAPDRAHHALGSRRMNDIESKWCRRVNRMREHILETAVIDNVNLRGNRIEQLLTGAGDQRDLGDIADEFEDGQIAIDVKTKLLGRASAPKAYNVDKMLSFLAQPGSILAFLLVGINLTAREVSVRLLPVLEKTLLNHTRVQPLWAGRSSRGVTQLSGAFGQMLDRRYTPSVEIEQAQRFLGRLLDL